MVVSNLRKMVEELPGLRNDKRFMSLYEEFLVRLELREACLQNKYGKYQEVYDTAVFRCERAIGNAV